jgi:hypothetical protein
LTQAALIFLVEEEVLSRHSRPRFLEASIGMRSYRQSGALDSLEPVSLLLQGGMRIRSRARIDRVDEIVGSEGPIFSIWDYKTGSSARYQHPDPFRQGRTVQPALYMEIVSAALRKKVSPAAAVSHFGYFFPGGRGRGLRILRRPDDLAHGKRIIENLCKTVSLGCFLATNNDREDCPFCDYIVICGDVEATAAASRRKLENPVNVDLDSIRELRNIGCQ